MDQHIVNFILGLMEYTNCFHFYYEWTIFNDTFQFGAI